MRGCAFKNKIANVSEGSVNNKPLIFTKKVNEKSKIIPLNLNNNRLGETRHFLPASKEWLNSIYAYDSNYIKSLPVADKNLMKLIQSYFNFFNKKDKSQHLRIRFRRLLVSKIFVSKAELKHTSSKVIITLYVYNKQKEMLANKIEKLEKILFSLSGKAGLIQTFRAHLRREKAFGLWKMIRNLKNLSFNDKFEILDLKKSYIMKRVEKEKKLILNHHPSIEVNGSFNIHNVRLYNEYAKNFLEKDLMAMTYYKLLLDFNKLKFEDAYLLRLSNLLSKIYNKEVEFNIVSLKYLYLNSDILSQAIALKLKNRDNRLLRVLRSSLSMVRLPFRNKITEKYKDKSGKYLINTLNNTHISSSLMGQNNKVLPNTTSDSLNKLLLGIFPNANGLPLFSLSSSPSSAAHPLGKSGVAKAPESDQTVETFLFNNLKHKAIGGVRLEAKGRLTRRFTASRSVFKVKWKGSLKNIDSSYRGLSTVILRGHAKSNIQYTNINSKNRVGSFGIKGWVSSR